MTYAFIAHRCGDLPAASVLPGDGGVDFRVLRLAQTPVSDGTGTTPS